MQVLISSPEVDELTRYLSVWTKDTIQNNKLNHKYFALYGKKPTRKKVEGILKKKSINLVLLNGHGADDKIAGAKNEIILDTNNAEALDGAVVHALSCNTAASLGPYAVQQGAKAYIGYDQPFIASIQKGKISNPKHDDTAALFLDAAFTAPKTLLNGKTPKQAIDATKKAYNNSIAKALNSDIQSDNDQFIGWLLWDRNHLTLCQRGEKPGNE